MQVVYAPRFRDDMIELWRYIADESPARAYRLRDEIKARTASLVDFPYMYRRSIYFETPAIRDLIIKGYVLPYRIDETARAITVLGITKYRKNFQES